METKNTNTRNFLISLSTCWNHWIIKNWPIPPEPSWRKPFGKLCGQWMAAGQQNIAVKHATSVNDETRATPNNIVFYYQNKKEWPTEYMSAWSAKLTVKGPWDVIHSSTSTDWGTGRGAHDDSVVDQHLQCSSYINCFATWTDGYARGGCISVLDHLRLSIIPKRRKAKECSIIELECWQSACWSAVLS